jgi:hypothetical protein
MPDSGMNSSGWQVLSANSVLDFLGGVVRIPVFVVIIRGAFPLFSGVGWVFKA